MTSKPQEPLVEAGDKAMDTPSAALNPENIASQPQDNLQRVADVSIDLPGKGKKCQRAHSGVVRSEPLISMLLSH